LPELNDSLERVGWEMGVVVGIGRFTVVTAGVITLGLTGVAAARATTADTHVVPFSYTHLRTLDNHHDSTSNVLTAINNHRIIAGYYGSGATGHPIEGYLLKPPYRQSNYLRVRFPGAKQTEPFGLNDKNVIVGAYSNTKSSNGRWYGFWAKNGHYHKLSFRASKRSAPRPTWVSGVNNAGIAVGVYVAASGQERAFRYNIKTGQFSVPVAGASSVWASAINNKGGQIVGYFKRSHGAWFSFSTLNGHLTKFSVAGAGKTEACAVNDHGVIVGQYIKNGEYRAFVRSSGKFHLYYIADGKGMGIFGINNVGSIVGWYQDKAGSLHGFLAVK
jgi:hypothetical protein